MRQLCHTDAGPYLRPFAPNSAWRNARVFIVGTNPATPLRDEFSSFDMYWEALTHDHGAFEQAYGAQRAGKVSKTARRAKVFEAALGQVNFLRTNVCAYPTRRWKELRGPQKAGHIRTGCEILAALADVCRPAAILCHGKEATQAVSELFSVSLDPYTPLDQQANVVAPWSDGQRLQLFAYPHLSGVGVRKGFSVSAMDAELEALGRRLAHEL